MPSVLVRPFRRADRDQVTALVNGHAAAVVPGVTASVNTVLTQFEREPGEVIVDPWVAERAAFVAEQDGAIAAAALLVRYRDDPDVGESYRNTGEVRWLVFRPLAPAGNPHWSDGQVAARALMTDCLARLAGWHVGRVVADGALPVPAVYGVPEQWPHVARLYAEAGFAAPPDAVEVVHLADLGSVPAPGGPPLPGLVVARQLGINGTRFVGRRQAEDVGYVEVDVLDAAERHPRQGGLADIGNLHVVPGHRRHGVATWLVAHAARWLRLGHVDRLLHYAGAGESDLIAFVETMGFLEVTRTRLGWELAVL